MDCQDTELLNCVSPVDLIKALNTLKRLSTSPQSHTPLKPQNKHFHGIDFKQYLNKKKQQPKNKLNNVNDKTPNSKILDHLKIQSKSIQNLKDLKSKSHSPISKNDNKPTQRKIPSKGPPSFNYLKLKVIKHQNTPLQQKQNFQASFQSKKILQQLSKTGRQYKPIHERTNELIKQKQQKITQKKRDNQFKKQLSEKQCTFKPKINKRKAKESQSHSKIIEKQQNLLSSDITIKQQNLQTYQNDDSLDNHTFQIGSYQQPTKRIQKPSVNELPTKKYKNKKFNFLLDLIH